MSAKNLHSIRGCLKRTPFFNGSGHGAQSTGHRAQSTGHRAQGTGHRAQGNGYRLPIAPFNNLYFGTSVEPSAFSCYIIANW